MGIPLNLIVPLPRVRAGKLYVPRWPRERLKALAREALNAKSLYAAAQIFKRAARGETAYWGKYLTRLYRGLAKLSLAPNWHKTPLPVFILDGNAKLPFAAFSSLPEFTCPGAGDCLNWCYSFRSWRCAGAWTRQMMNTLLLKFRPDVIATHFRKLDDDIVVRLYVDGDFDSLDTIGLWFGLLFERPDLRAYGYSKSWDLLWEYAQHNALPKNYRLNLSSGGKSQTATREMMKSLPITRGDFLAIPIKYSPGDIRKHSFARYDDPNYHVAVRKAAVEMGLKKTFSCPGKCVECASANHACGSDKFEGVTIAIGIH